MACLVRQPGPWVRCAPPAVDHVGFPEQAPKTTALGRSRGRSLDEGASGRRVGLGDRRDVELKLDLLADQYATGLQSRVEAQAPVGTADGRATFETHADVAVGVLRRADLLEDNGHRMGDGLNGQVAGDTPVGTVTLDSGGDEGDVGVVLNVEEVGGLEVAVALLLACGDAGGLDRH